MIHYTTFCKRIVSVSKTIGNAGIHVILAIQRQNSWIFVEEYWWFSWQCFKKSISSELSVYK